MKEDLTLGWQLCWQRLSRREGNILQKNVRMESLLFNYQFIYTFSFDSREPVDTVRDRGLQTVRVGHLVTVTRQPPMAMTFPAVHHMQFQFVQIE